MINCKICNKQSPNSPMHNQIVTIDCDICGKYQFDTTFMTDTYTDQSLFYKVQCWIYEQNKFHDIKPLINQEVFDKVIQSRDKKIKEKYNSVLKKLAKTKENSTLDSHFFKGCWIKNDEEFEKIIRKAVDENYIICDIHDTTMQSHIMFGSLTFDGLEYIESLEQPNKSSKKIFIAFNFHDDLTQIFNITIKNAIKKLGFHCIIVNQDTSDPNKPISDEIISELKSSRIVIADFTNHSNSVYFESGFAMGMNLPIIWTCKKGHENELSFDTRQYPHIIWSDKNNLKKQIINRIKVIV